MKSHPEFFFCSKLHNFWHVTGVIPQKLTMLRAPVQKQFISFLRISVPHFFDIVKKFLKSFSFSTKISIYKILDSNEFPLLFPNVVFIANVVTVKIIKNLFYDFLILYSSKTKILLELFQSVGVCIMSFFFSFSPAQSINY